MSVEQKKNRDAEEWGLKESGGWREYNGDYKQTDRQPMDRPVTG